MSNVAPKCGSLDNAAHKAGGGDKKVMGGDTNNKIGRANTKMSMDYHKKTCHHHWEIIQ